MDSWFTEAESSVLLRQLFPEGMGGADVWAVLCPEGWRETPLRLAFHPTPEQQFEEALRWHENFLRLRELGQKKKPAAPLPPPDPPPDRETFLTESRARPDIQDESDEREIARLVGLCLWDILSDNHDVILPDGTRKHLGSFRTSAGMIADFFSGDQPSSQDEWYRFDRMDYCEFYMGSWAVGGRTDLTPVYRLIFARLQGLGLDWHYAFPRIGAIRFAKPESDEPEWANYDPGAAFEETEKEREHAKLQSDLEEAHQQSLEEAKNRPPPLIVIAYRAVFGRDPSGWPPWEENSPRE